MGVVYTPSSSGVSEGGPDVRTYADRQSHVVGARMTATSSSLLGRAAGTPDGHVKWPLALRPFRSSVRPNQDNKSSAARNDNSAPELGWEE